MRLTLQLVGLDLGLIVGLTAGLLSFIPYVGTITGGVTSIGLALAQFPTWAGVAEVTGVFVAGQLLEGYVIYPRFLGDRVELHAVWVIFALFAGGAVFGFLGVLLAVPVGGDDRRVGAILAATLHEQPALFRPARRYDGMSAARQLALPFVHEAAYDPAEFLEGDCNAAAMAWLDAPWPGNRLAHCGGSRAAARPICCMCGPTKWGAHLLAGPALTGLVTLPESGGLAVDQADAAPEQPLLHLLNAAAEVGLPVLLAARNAPARWQTRLPDLASRLRAVTSVEVARPDDAMLRVLFASLLAARQLVVPEPVQDWLAAAAAPRPGGTCGRQRRCWTRPPWPQVGA